MEFKIEPNDDGFLATCKSMDGAFAEGKTKFEALYNLFDVMKMIEEFNKEHRKKNKKVEFDIKTVQFTIPIAA
jgi:predicted RNase H-like HicB family nuclease